MALFLGQFFPVEVSPRQISLALLCSRAKLLRLWKSLVSVIRDGSAMGQLFPCTHPFVTASALDPLGVGPTLGALGPQMFWNCWNPVKGQRTQHGWPVCRERRDKWAPQRHCLDTCRERLSGCVYRAPGTSDNVAALLSLTKRAVVPEAIHFIAALHACQALMPSLLLVRLLR